MQISALIGFNHSIDRLCENREKKKKKTHTKNGSAILSDSAVKQVMLKGLKVKAQWMWRMAVAVAVSVGVGVSVSVSVSVAVAVAVAVAVTVAVAVVGGERERWYEKQLKRRQRQAVVQWW